MQAILQQALPEIGVAEIAGSDHNDRIVRYADEAGHDWVNDDETPWCSIFMDWVAMKAGAERSKSATARSWLNVGMPVEHPEPGDVVVFWRGAPDAHTGHVGIFCGFSRDGSRVYVFGGNQDDQVGISAYPEDRLLGFRRLRPTSTPPIPDAPLKRGDRGRAVVQLQDALKLAGCEAGTSDGIYGPKTEGAVRSLQTRDASVAITGTYDADTQDFLASLFD